MTRHRIRVLFAPLADADIMTSQNLTARDVALHLDPERFSNTFFSGSISSASMSMRLPYTESPAFALARSSSSKNLGTSSSLR